MAKIIFLLCLIAIGAYKAIANHLEDRALQKSINRYNRSINEEFEVTVPAKKQ